MKSNLMQVFNNINGNSFVGLTTETVVPLKGGKKNPMQGRVVKVTTGSSVMVFQNKNVNGYENMVNRRLAKEGKNPEFTVSPRVWGHRIEGTPIVEHKGKNYLEVIFLKAGETKYFLGGKEINKSEIIGLEPAKVDDESQDSLNDKVIVRTFAEDSIVEVNVNGQHFS